MISTEDSGKDRFKESRSSTKREMMEWKGAVREKYATSDLPRQFRGYEALLEEDSLPVPHIPTGASSQHHKCIAVTLRSSIIYVLYINTRQYHFLLLQLAPRSSRVHACTALLLEARLYLQASGQPQTHIQTSPDNGMYNIHFTCPAKRIFSWYIGRSAANGITRNCHS